MEPIEEGYYYHIYNRGAGKSDIFRTEEDYQFFLKKYLYYLYNSTQTFAWCLLRNHFHFQLRIRTHEEQIAHYQKTQKNFPSGSFHEKLSPNTKPFNASKQIGHLMNSYTKYFNQKYDRSGTLVEGPFKRKRVIDEDHLIHLICYIHRNPIHHRISVSYSEYPYSSYNFILMDEEKCSCLERDTILKLFGGQQNFIQAHEEFRLMLGEEFYLD